MNPRSSYDDYTRQLDGPRPLPWGCEKTSCRDAAVFVNFFYDVSDEPSRLRSYLLCAKCMVREQERDPHIEWAKGSRYSRIIYPDIVEELTTSLEIAFEILRCGVYTPAELKALNDESKNRAKKTHRHQ